MRSVAKLVAFCVGASLAAKYTASNKLVLEAEESGVHKVALSVVREARKSGKAASRTVRVRRQSIKDEAEAAETARIASMSAEEKAAFRRAEKRSEAALKGELSLQLAPIPAEQSASEQSTAAGPAGAASESHLGVSHLGVLGRRRSDVSAQLAALATPMSPLARSMGGRSLRGLPSSPSYMALDDMTLLATDDYRTVNDVIRRSPAPCGAISGAAISGAGISRGRRAGTDEDHEFSSVKTKADPKKTLAAEVEKEGRRTTTKTTPLPRGARRTLVQRFRAAVRRSTRPSQKIDFDSPGDFDLPGDGERAPGERAPGERRRSIQELATTAGDGFLAGGGVAAGGAADLTAALVKLGVRATRIAVEVTSPVTKAAVLGSKRMTKIATDYIDAYIDDEQQAKEAKMTAAERSQHRAAKAIQRCFRAFYYTEGRRQQRAALLITRTVRDYVHLIHREKWVLLIKMDRKEKREKDRQKSQAVARLEKDKGKAKKTRRHGAENAARKSGWSAKDDKESTKWTEREEAIVAACCLKHGYPQDDDNGFAVYFNLFPNRSRRGVKSKLAEMKEDGSLGRKETLEGIDGRELMKMGLGVVEKKKQTAKERRKLKIEDYV